MPSILRRLQILWNAQAHYQLDQIEDPEVMLRQAVRELHDQVRAARAALVDALTWEKRLNNRLADNTQTTTSWRERAERAMRTGDEAYARIALGRQLELEDALPTLERDLKQAQRVRERIQQQCETLEQKWRIACQEQSRLSARRHLAKTEAHLQTQAINSSYSLDVDDSLDQLRQEVEVLEARAEAINSYNHGDDTLCHGLRSQPDSSRVDAALNALRQRVAD